MSSVHKIMVPVTYDKLNLEGIYSSAIRCPHEETAARMEAAIRQAKEEDIQMKGQRIETFRAQADQQLQQKQQRP